MKHLFFSFLILLALLVFGKSHAATCTSISRTNAASLSVLTSSKYNTDLNTAYTAINAFDGGCITSGTLESDALNTTQFAPLLKGLHQGCKVIYSNASTLQIDKCLSAVNGNFVTTTTTTNVSFGCTGCSSEVASTSYYVYIQTGSTGSTLTPLILTTAPNNDGYDNSGNKVLARFYNNGSSDIDQYSIDQWSVNQFSPTSKTWTSYTPTTQGFGTPTIEYAKWRRVDDSMQIMLRLTTGTVTADEARIGLPSGYTIPSSVDEYVSAGFLAFGGFVQSHPATVLITGGDSFLNFAKSDGGAIDQLTIAQTGSQLLGNSDQISFTITVPIQGWKSAAD